MDELTVIEPQAPPERQGVLRRLGGASRTRRGEERTYRLVGPDEADAAHGLISVEAPLGRALLGKAAGDVARVHRPIGSVELTVVAVRWAREG